MKSEPLPDSFARHDEAQAILENLIREDSTFAHLVDARIVAIGSQQTPMLNAWPVEAWIAAPKVQGVFRGFFEWALSQLAAPVTSVPEYVVMVDVATWGSKTAEEQERLLFHELCHVIVREDENGVPKCHRDGRMMLRLRPHEFEFFDAEVRKYGPEVCQVEQAASGIADGHRAAQARRRPRRVA